MVRYKIVSKNIHCQELEMVSMNEEKFVYGLNIGDDQVVVIETSATVEQFKKAIAFAKTLDDYSTEDVINVLKSVELFAEHIHLDNEFAF